MIIRDPGGIRDFLAKIAGNRRIVFAFVGSPLRRDDRAALILVDKLGSEQRGNILFLKCEYGLENCLSEITSFKPEVLVVVDAVYAEELEPGEVILTSKEHLREKIGLVTTHNIPITLVLETLQREAGVKEVYLLGIRVKDTGFGEEVSIEVLSSIDKLLEIIKSIAGETAL